MQSTKRTRGNSRPFFCSRLVNHRDRSRQGPPDPGRGNTPRNVRRTHPGQTRTNTPGPGAGTQSAGSRHTPTPGHVRQDSKGRTGTATGTRQEPGAPQGHTRSRKPPPGARKPPPVRYGSQSRSQGPTRTRQDAPGARGRARTGKYPPGPPESPREPLRAARTPSQGPKPPQERSKPPQGPSRDRPGTPETGPGRAGTGPTLCRHTRRRPGRLRAILSNPSPARSAHTIRAGTITRTNRPGPIQGEQTAAITKRIRHIELIRSFPR